jgi:hypothetical protein
MTERFTERQTPYIGISGVVSEVHDYLIHDLRWIDLEDLNPARTYAFGVKATHKTQFLDQENKYGKEWYPVGDDFSNAIDKGGVGLRVAQTFFDPEYVSDPEYRKIFIDKICRRGKAWLNAIQFDMLPWHNDDSLLAFLEQVKNETGHAILLQAHSESMSQLGPEGVAQKLGKYAHALDYILFDASHGKGMRMNADALQPFLEAGYNSNELSSVGFSVAGGLNAEVVREALPVLLTDYPDISWDAEGQLHPPKSDGTRPVDFKLAHQYAEASEEVIKRYT